MSTKSVLSMLMLTAAVLTFTFAGNAEAVNVQVNGYLPAPPGVNVQIDAGRPYYVESHRRVYIEREPRYYKEDKRHYKKQKKHHEDRGNHYGHEEHGGRGGHGR
ncbi:MAG TPA: hypothetical protein VIK40_11570 [Geomonas sp.]